MLVSVVIPCYNSEHTIEDVVDQCMQTFDQMDGFECEMVLVNDYSKDRTFEAIQRACAKYPGAVTGLNLAKNFGQHAAIMAGLHEVHGDYVVGMDDDLQNHPSQIKAFIEKAEEGYDVVFGVFKQRKFSPWKDFVGSVSRTLLWHLVERPQGIQMSSFWLAKKFVIDEIKDYGGTDVFIQLLFFRTTANIANIEIEHFERKVGKSNYTFKKGLKLFMSFVNYSVVPLKIASFLGMLFSLIGLLGAIIVFINKLITPNMHVGWSSLMCAILMLFGIMFLLMGIIGDYVGKIVMMETNKPQFVVRQKIGKNAENGQKAEPRTDGPASFR